MSFSCGNISDIFLNCYCKILENRMDDTSDFFLICFDNIVFSHFLKILEEEICLSQISLYLHLVHGTFSPGQVMFLGRV